MEAAKTSTLEARLLELLLNRQDDATTGVANGVVARVQEARDAWLKERLSERDFEEWRRLYYFGPAGKEFPDGWERAESDAEVAVVNAAYQQGLKDGARLLAMLLGLVQLPQLPLK